MSSFLEELFGLKGQTAIVTGATGGLGSALATALAKAGADIISIEVPNDPNSKKLVGNIAATGAKLHQFDCDLSNGKAVRECFDKIFNSGQKPSILINAAGVMRRNACEAVTDDEIDLLVDVNLKSVFISMQAFGQRLLSENRPGKIVNICSVTAYLAGFNTSIYSTTKGGVLQMTKAFANEWTSKGINVNCIAPGFMQTPMTQQYQDDEKMTAYLQSRCPSGRWGQPKDLVSAMIYLVAPGSDFVSGSCVVVDGGYTGK